MNYLRIYNELIEKRRLIIVEGYHEKHRVIPGCMGGTYTKENTVKLTAREHFIAHWLLYKIYKLPKLLHAWYAMCRVGIGQEARRVNSHYFEKVKRQRAAYLSANSRGELNNFYGKKHSLEARQRMSKIQKEIKNWESFTEDHKKNLLAAQKKPKTLEHRAKIGRKNLRMLENRITGEIRRVPEGSPELQNPEWVNPRTLHPEPTFKCEHCSVVTTRANLKRWHNDNCKQRNLNED